MEKNKNIYMNQFAVHKKLTQNCTSIHKEIAIPGPNVDYNIGK